MHPREHRSRPRRGARVRNADASREISQVARTWGRMPPRRFLARPGDPIPGAGDVAPAPAPASASRPWLRGEGQVEGQARCPEDRGGPVAARRGRPDGTRAGPVAPRTCLHDRPRVRCRPPCANPTRRRGTGFHHPVEVAGPAVTRSRSRARAVRAAPRPRPPVRPTKRAYRPRAGLGPRCRSGGPRTWRGRCRHG